MKKWAKINDQNIVEQVIVLEENKDVDWITERFPGEWIESPEKEGDITSSGTRGLAGIGLKYDNELNAFIVPQFYPSWTFNREKLLWEPPTPQDNPSSYWDEESQSWILH